MANGNMPGSSGLLNRDRDSRTSRTSRCQDVLVSMALLLNGVNIGLNMGLLGPTLPDLALQTSSTIPEMNLIFIFSSVAYMAGSIVCGFMLGRFEGYLLVSATLMLQAVTTAAAPWFTNLTLLTLFISLSYFFSTVITAGMVYLCFQLEKTQARTMVQILFLLFNLGKGVVPFIVAPFLTPARISANDPVMPRWPFPTIKPTTTKQPRHGRHFFENSAYLSEDVTDNLHAWALEDKGTYSYVGYGYVIVAIFSLLLSSLYMTIAFRNGFHLWVKPSDIKKNNTVANMTNANISAVTSCARKVAVLLLFFSMTFLLCGMESVDSGLLMSFLTEYLGRGKDMGVLATALYQSIKVVMCIVVVLTVKYIHPSPILIVDFTFMLAATMLMSVTLHFHTGDALLWITFVLLAIGMSNSYATLASWLQTRYPITGAVTGILTVSSGFGSMVIPTLTISLLDAYGAIMFPLVLLGCTVLCFVTYFVTRVLMREGCCPRVDIKDDNSPMEEEHQPLFDSALSRSPRRSSTYGEEHKEWQYRMRSPQTVQHQPNQPVLYSSQANTSSFITQPSAPNESALFYGSGHRSKASSPR